MPAHIRRKREVDGGELLHHAQQVHVRQRDAAELTRHLEAKQALLGERTGHVRMHFAPLIHGARIE